MDQNPEKIDDLEIKNIVAHKDEPTYPLVSVQICTYNRANLLSRAVESALGQDYKNLEIVIIDDCSTDETRDLISNMKEKDDRIKYFRNEENLGITASRNKALRLSNGRYIAVLDSDDCWTLPEKISWQVEFLEENPEFALVGTFAEIINEHGEKVSDFAPNPAWHDIKDEFLIRNQFAHSTVLYKKSAIREYNDKYFIWEDLATWLDAGRSYKMENLLIFTTKIARHSGGISKKNKIKGVMTLGKIIRDNKKFYPNYFRAELLNLARFFRALF